jgi:transposase
LQGIRNGSIDPKSLHPDERRPVVSLLKDEGQSTAEIAHLLKRSDKTIELDKRALREENTITKDPELVKQMAGRLISGADLSKQRIQS